MAVIITKEGAIPFVRGVVDGRIDWGPVQLTFESIDASFKGELCNVLVSVHCRFEQDGPHLTNVAQLVMKHLKPAIENAIRAAGCESLNDKDIESPS